MSLKNERLQERLAHYVEKDAKIIKVLQAQQRNVTMNAREHLGKREPTTAELKSLLLRYVSGHRCGTCLLLSFESQYALETEHHFVVDVGKERKCPKALQAQ